MARKSKLDSFLDEVLKQAVEDRAAAKGAYDELKSQINGFEGYAVNGITLAKLIELMQKQTNQMMEFYKVLDKSQKEKGQESTGFEPDEVEDIYKIIKETK